MRIRTLPRTLYVLGDPDIDMRTMLEDPGGLRVMDQGQLGSREIPLDFPEYRQEQYRIAQVVPVNDGDMLHVGEAVWAVRSSRP
jgi:hypothetical protein